MIKRLKDNRGIVVADALIAILLMTIFVGIISTLCYNIYIAASFTKRNSTALDYGIKIIEYIDQIPYENVVYGDNENDGLIKYINQIDTAISAQKYGSNEQLTTPYKATINIQNYNENTDKQDLIKTITLTIEYNLGDSEKEVIFERVKQK